MRTKRRKVEKLENYVCLCLSLVGSGVVCDVEHYGSEIFMKYSGLTQSYSKKEITSLKRAVAQNRQFLKVKGTESMTNINNQRNANQATTCCYVTL